MVDHSATSVAPSICQGPKYDSSLTIQLPDEPTFKALASGGVHTPWWDLLFGEAGCCNT